MLDVIDYKKNLNKSFILEPNDDNRKLDILVENMGRVNYVNGWRDVHTFAGQLKGILGKVVTKSKLV